jgi:hypothetical protein
MLDDELLKWKFRRGDGVVGGLRSAEIPGIKEQGGLVRACDRQ